MKQHSDCDLCSGKPSLIRQYRCEKHDVCLICGAKRSELTEIPWGALSGFICNPCKIKDHETKKAEALSKMGKYDKWIILE